MIAYIEPEYKSPFSFLRKGPHPDKLLRYGDADPLRIVWCVPCKIPCIIETFSSVE